MLIIVTDLNFCKVFFWHRKSCLGENTMPFDTIRHREIHILLGFSYKDVKWFCPNTTFLFLLSWEYSLHKLMPKKFRKPIYVVLALYRVGAVMIPMLIIVTDLNFSEVCFDIGNFGLGQTLCHLARFNVVKITFFLWIFLSFCFGFGFTVGTIEYFASVNVSKSYLIPMIFSWEEHGNNVAQTKNLFPDLFDKLFVYILLIFL